LLDWLWAGSSQGLQGLNNVDQDKEQHNRLQLFISSFQKCNTFG